MSNFVALSSLAMDLDRVSLGLYRKSYVMAEKFTKEALLRKSEIDIKTVKPYIRRLLDDMELLLRLENQDEKAEGALMYSTLFQNAALHL